MRDCGTGGDPVIAIKPYFDDGQVSLFVGDCLDVLAGLPDCSIDAVVTDPPYGLEFMGREWDSFRPSKARIRTRADGRTNPAGGKSVTSTPESYTAGQPFQAWCLAWSSECLRVLKPGGHLLAFGGTRTWHRLACAVEDAGFEIRDSITWLYGSGFPKSLDVSKAIDKAAGAEREAIGPDPFASRKPSGTWTGRTYAQDAYEGIPGGSPVTLAATEAAARWEGWGTALKPAHEPIVVARKPVAGTVAANVAEHGTGALNIDGCRVAGAGPEPNARQAKGTGLGYQGGDGERGAWDGTAGRWPPNVLLAHSADCEPIGTRDVRGNHRLNPTVQAARLNVAKGAESERSRGARGHGNADGTETVEAWDCVPGCPVAELDAQSGALTSGANPARRSSDKFRDAYGEFAGQQECTVHRGADTGGASRFFPAFRYEAKAPASERPRLADGTAHPTVKPLELMRWLVRLVTPPGGLVLDPFGGSGTTAHACVIEGFRCILAEKDPAYAELIKARLAKPIQPVMFGEAG